MIKYGFTFLTILLFVACSSDRVENEGLIGRWELIEVLADPGDGSGTFQPVDSDKSIDFKSDGTFISRRSLCVFSPDSDTNGVGRYSDVEKLITPSGCNSQVVLSYKIEASYLIVYYPCIEPCVEKYRKPD